TAGQRRPERLRDAAKLHAFPLGKASHLRFEGAGCPFGGFQLRQQAAEQHPGLIRQEFCSFLIKDERPLGDEVAGAVNQILQGLGARLKTWQRSCELLPPGCGEARLKLRTVLEFRQGLPYAGQQFIVRRIADVMAVEVLELGKIEARRRAPDAVKIEPVDHLLSGEDLVVAVAPPESDKIVPQDRKSTRLNSSHVKISYAV